MNFRKVVKHKKLLYLFTFLLLMGIFFLPSQNVKAAGWEKSGWNEWKNGDEKVYVEGNKLYKSSANGKKSVLSSWREKEYNDNEDDDLRIIGVRGKNVILGMASYTKTSKVYAVDMSKKKKKVIAKNCCPNTIVNDGGRICGDYIYANTGKVSDTGAYEVWVWKFQKDGSLKRIKKLGDHVQTIIIDGKKIIYSYHKTSSQKTMSVYSCNFSGADKKKLFTISAKEEYAQLFLEKVTKDEIVCNGPSAKYVYNRKTKKVSTRQ